MHELRQMAARMFGDFVKAVVDIERGVLAVDAELHADLEAALLEDGAEQRHLWGVNLYPEAQPDDPLITASTTISAETPNATPPMESAAMTEMNCSRRFANR